MRYPSATRDELTAPAEKFRVLGVNVEDNCGEIYVVGDFESMSTAEQIAVQTAGIGSPVYIYNDRAELIVRYGSWH